MRRWLKSLIRKAVVLSMIFVVCANVIITKSTKNNIKTVEQVCGAYKNDCILVLGAGIKEDGTPSDILSDRLDCAVASYKAGCSDVILVSGDKQSNYNEVEPMKAYLVEKGIPEQAIIVDDKGFSTFESVRNAKETFVFEKICIITQKYHLYRALYVAGEFKMDAVGISANKHQYKNQYLYDAREIAARTKDFVQSTIYQEKIVQKIVQLPRKVYAKCVDLFCVQNVFIKFKTPVDMQSIFFSSKLTSFFVCILSIYSPKSLFFLNAATPMLHGKLAWSEG